LASPTDVESSDLTAPPDLNVPAKGVAPAEQPRARGNKPLTAFLFALAKRMVWNVFVLWVIFTASFALMRAMPGSPLSRERSLPPAIERAMQAKFGLDRPIYEQYGAMLASYARLDFLPSMRLVDFHVNEIVETSLPISMSLGIVALAFALILGLSAGIVSAIRRKSVLDRGSMALALLGISIPNFVLAALLIIVFCFLFPIFPVAGWGSPMQMFLPALCLAAPYAGYIARLTRTGLMETLNLDYVRTAKAKGLRERTVILKHAMRGAITPVVSFLGPATAGILTGSVVVEKIFYIPGLGNHFIEAVMMRDYTVSMACVVIYAVVLLAANTLVDLAYSLIDPRVKFEG
jgi:ABC-type dipeptide/oligopeptide/nickel transport system permease component